MQAETQTQDGSSPGAVEARGGTPPSGRSAIPYAIALLCLLLGYFQPFGISRDYPGYDTFWNTLRDAGLSFALTSRFEPGFTFVSWLLTLVLASNEALSAVLAASSIFVKMTAVRAFVGRTGPVSIAAIFYLFRFLPLHELTQFRASLALAVLLAAFALRWTGHRVMALALCCVAPVFHLSSVFVAPFVCLSGARRRQVLFWAVAAFAFARFVLPWILQTASGDLAVLELYELAEFAALKPLSPAVLLDISVIVVGFAMWHRMPEAMRHVLLLQCVGISLFWATIYQPVLAHRLREAFSVFWVYYVAWAFAEGGEFRAVSVIFTLASSAGHAYLFWFNPADPYFIR